MGLDLLDLFICKTVERMCEIDRKAISTLVLESVLALSGGLFRRWCRRGRILKGLDRVDDRCKSINDRREALQNT